MTEQLTSTWANTAMTANNIWSTKKERDDFENMYFQQP